MHYLCENQPLAIFQVLLRLWKIVLEENVFEYKLIALHAFITFFEIIPRELPSDSYVCNFICKSFTHGIKSCENSKELLAFSKAVKIVLENLLPDKADVIQQSLNELVSALSVKQKGLVNEGGTLTNDTKLYLGASGKDVIDHLNDLGQVDYARSCPTIASFTENVEQLTLSLKSPRLT